MKFIERSSGEVKDESEIDFWFVGVRSTMLSEPLTPELKALQSSPGWGTAALHDPIQNVVYYCDPEEK